MPDAWISLLVWSAYGYLAGGLLLLPWWHLRGLARLDATAAHGTPGFRVLISGGLVLLWPWLLRRSLTRTGTPPAERNAHRDTLFDGKEP